jgi:DNA-binding CsgD family transcriptional regulator
LAPVVEAMTAAVDVDARFAVLTRALARLGLDQVNYGFFDPVAADEAQAQVLFLSTMERDWLQHYDDVALHRHDSMVITLRQGRLMPYRWGESVIARLDDPLSIDAARQAQEAGIRSALCVPLTSPLAPTRPMGAMTLGSSLHDERDLVDGLGELSAGLLALTQLFHALSRGPLVRDRSGARPLSVRERDCLTYLAHGLRQDAIAHRLGVSLGTVELHLRNARLKMAASSLAQAVARALTYGEIDLG